MDNKELSITSDSEYKKLLSELKEKVRSSQLKAAIKVNYELRTAGLAIKISADTTRPPPIAGTNRCEQIAIKILLSCARICGC